jgi:hypothetical protein
MLGEKATADESDSEVAGEDSEGEVRDAEEVGSDRSETRERDRPVINDWEGGMNSDDDWTTRAGAREDDVASGLRIVRASSESKITLSLSSSTISNELG